MSALKRYALPLLISALGIVTTIGAWDSLREERREQELRTLDAIAHDSRGSIETQAERQLDALRELAADWARFGPRSMEAWRAEAGRTLEIFPGLVALGWVDPAGRVVRAVGERGDPSANVEPEEHALLAQLAAIYADSPDAVMVGPLAESDEGPRYRVVVPAYQGKVRKGVLVAEVAIGPMLEAVLHDSAPGYAVVVSWKGEELYRRGTVADGRGWWRDVGAVELSTNERWRVAYAPTSSQARDLSPWPGTVLAGGILISLMLGALIHQLRSAEGEVLSLDAQRRDLGLLNQELEERVEERTGELAAAMDELEAFTYSVSHDLRSPLGSILAFAGALEEDCSEKLAPEEREMLERISGSARTSMQLIEGLLALSRAGRTPLECEAVDVQALAQEVWAEVATGDEGEVSFEPGRLPIAWADPVLLRQVVSNLLGNALKYSAPREKPRIALSGEERGSETVYCVQDNGVGFDERYAKKLFRPFERLHATTEFAGTGVGLALSARVVQRHGGRIWAESEPDAGARFFFSLPRPPMPPDSEPM